MTKMTNPISVPVRLDATWSDGHTLVSPPTVDFKQLKKTVSNEGNFSNSQPWLGDTSHVANNNDYVLPAGLHLHWTLPKALRHGTTVYVLDYHVFNELVWQGVPCSLVNHLKEAVTIGKEYTLEELNNTLNGLKFLSPLLEASDFDLDPTSKSWSDLISPESHIEIETHIPNFKWDSLFLEIYGPIIIRLSTQMKFPPAPNRWLVVRKKISEETTKAWIVESDRLTIPSEHGTAPQGTVPSTVVSEFDHSFIKKWGTVTIKQGFKYLGFKSEAESWAETVGSLRLTPLTATGNGSVDFASFYQNCQGVFGFHDTTATEDEKYDYTVVGWFSDPLNDPLSNSYNVHPWSLKDRKNRLNQFKWFIENPDWSKIDGSIYASKLTVLGTECRLQAQTPVDGSMTVAIGNTAGEALSAYIAKGNEKSDVGLSPESILNATQSGVLSQVLEPDGPNVIENHLHKQSFQSESLGWNWILSSPSPKHSGLSESGETKTISLTDKVAQALNELNIAQASFDAIQRTQSSQRQLLFADWCRSLHLETDASGAHTNLFPNGNTWNNQKNEQLYGVAGKVIWSSAEAIKKASLGEATTTYMSCYLALEKLYLAHANLIKELSGIPNGSDLILKRQSAPRFYKPNDPVVMMVDSNGKSLKNSPANQLPVHKVQNKVFLFLQKYSPVEKPLPFLPPNWNDNKGAPSIHCIVGVLEQLQGTTATQSWRPLSLYWKASYHHFDGTGNIATQSVNVPPFTVTNYDSNFISKNFIPDAAGIELIPKKGKSALDRGEAIYEGRVTLSGHAKHTMKENILRLTNQVDDPPTTSEGLNLKGILGKGITKTIIDYAYDSEAMSLSQNLNGFHDRLLMQKRIPQVSTFATNYASASWQKGNNTPTPQFDSNSQSFFNEIGMQKKTSPYQHDIYNPIRGGKCEITDLILVDAFGQMRSWRYSASPSNTIISQALPNRTAGGSNAAPAFFLPPRLSQSSRLLFRWLAADGSNDVESNQHTATTPICGWLALNRVNENIMVFTKEGTLLGWIPAGGGKFKFMPEKSLEDIKDPYLIQVVSQIQETNGNTFYDDINEALLTIEPRSHRHFVNRSVLESRAIAIARASIKLELAGVPSPHQGYEALATMKLDNNENPPRVSSTSPFVKRETCGFEKVNFPVRLGDVSMDDDGLVAYWKIINNTISENYTLVNTDPEAEPDSEPTICVTPDPNGNSTTVLLLFDPKCPVHISSGILPVKDITVPPELYTKSLQNMEYIMQVGPIITPNNIVTLPLPAETNTNWQWLTLKADGSGWNDPINPKKTDGKMHPISDPAVMRNGFLKIKINKKNKLWLSI